MNKKIILVIVIVLVVGAIYYIESQKINTGSLGGGQSVDIVSKDDRVKKKASEYETAKEIVAQAGFINTEEFVIQDFIGKKVILVDFWTYSCINCQRTMPYLRSWYEKYNDQGLEIIGIHTPEFEFEKDYDNVLDATQRFEIKYPVVLDNDYGTWRNYQNRYWPRKYLIDIDGFIVYDHIGEGAYDKTEQKIQELLEERMKVLDEEGEITKAISQPKDAEKVDFRNPRSPETYFGSDRNEFLGNGSRGKTGEQTFTAPASPRKNTLYFDGTWNIQPEFALNVSSNAKIVYRYEGNKVFIVASADRPVNVKLLLDGNPAGSSAGRDVDSSSFLTIQEDRLYRLIEDSKHGEHTLEIIIQEPGFRAFAFTFG